MLGLALAAAAAAPALGAQSISARLAGRASPELAALVEELGTAAIARGLPADPLIQKAVEGTAKGIPTDRIAAAVHVVVSQLDTAAVAIRMAGMTSPDTTLVAAGGFAVTAGLNGRHIGSVVHAAEGHERADLLAALRVAGTLAALGVPPEESVALVSATLRAEQAPSDLLALPGRVQAEVSRGSTPAQAAAGLARAAAAQGRRGPPPGLGRPDNPGRPNP
jgi:hypothetical protein